MSPRRREVLASPVQRIVDQLVAYEKVLSITNTIATDGVQYSGVITVGTVAANIMLETIDPGVDVRLKSLEVSLTVRFDNLIAAVGSIHYVAEIARNNQGTIDFFLRISPTMALGVGSLTYVEQTLTGQVDLTGLLIPEAPLNIRVYAAALVASSMTGRIKNTSYVSLVGNALVGN